MNSIFFIIVLVSILFSCTQDEPIPVINDLKPSQKSAAIISADNEFGFDLFKKLNATLQSESNTMISPLSVSLALAMVYNGSEGNTKTQMEKTLHKNNMTAEEINQSYLELIEGLVSHDPKVELSISNAIFYRNSFNIKPAFINTNKKYFAAEVQALDFNKSTETLNTVNGWVNTKTKSKISKIIDRVNPFDVMFLLNAIYFNGEWTYSFNSKETVDQNFTTISNQVVQAPTMFIEKPFNYYSNADFQMLEMPYGSKKYSMLIILPTFGKNVNEVIPLLNSEKLDSWMNNMTEQKKKVYLPKFEFSFGNSLKDELAALGMPDAFDAAMAKFGAITDDDQLYISEVMHKTFIKVDEKGTEAAAVTGITMGVTSVGPDQNFRVDRPFVFAIREKDTKAILFIGKVIDPTKK
jgi:serpin B